MLRGLDCTAVTTISQQDRSRIFHRYIKWTQDAVYRGWNTPFRVVASHVVEKSPNTPGHGVPYKEGGCPEGGIATPQLVQYTSEPMHMLDIPMDSLPYGGRRAADSIEVEDNDPPDDPMTDTNIDNCELLNNLNWQKRLVTNQENYNDYDDGHESEDGSEVQLSKK
ncbi:hypothetical protein KM043_016310 [Ampulex compressa]|nr:hypothetical protein KM043_016310 [Ampulex compressa]